MATGPSVTNTLGITKSEVHTPLSGGTSPDSPLPTSVRLGPSKMPRCHCAFPPIGPKGTSGGERPSLAYRYTYEGAPPISRHDPTPFCALVQQYPQAEEAYLHVLALDSSYEDAKTELERTRLRCITVSPPPLTALAPLALH